MGGLVFLVFFMYLAFAEKNQTQTISQNFIIVISKRD